MKMCICLMCLNDRDLIELSSADRDNLFNKFIKYVFPDYIIPKQKQPSHLCTSCRDSLLAFHKFKRICMANNMWFVTYYMNDDLNLQEEPMLFENKTEIKELNSEYKAGIECKKEVLPLYASPIKSLFNEKTENLEVAVMPDTNTEIKENSVNNTCVSNLEKHQLDQKPRQINVKRKTFKCEICLKIFSRKEHLQTHLKRHAGIKEFECETCKKRFVQKSHLMEHIKNIHIITNVRFKCKICLKTLKSRRSLNQHMAIHTGIKSFQCSLCDKKFLRNCTLKKHKKNCKNNTAIV